MKARWRNEGISRSAVILAGDVGGTNISLALIDARNGEYTMLCSSKWQSARVDGVVGPVRELLKSARAKMPGVHPDICCISAAGPVSGNRCVMTNCAWDVDGDIIRRETGIETRVINDFLAISHAVPLVDTDDPELVTKLPHSDGTYPRRREGVKLIIGPGTGLGVGFLVPNGRSYLPFPSEGGHSDFAAFDEETWGLREYVAGKNGTKPGVEPFVSGQGIINIYRYLRDTRGDAAAATIREIDALPDPGKPALISRLSGSDSFCRSVMTLFVKILGGFAGSMSSVFLPSGGVYLAGGIPARNERIILENDLFMRHFEVNYRPSIASFLGGVPVYIIRDYSISLYGAADAAMQGLADRSAAVMQTA